MDADLRVGGQRKVPSTPGGRPRAARAGERVQWTSINGSPLTGIITADGRVKTLPHAQAHDRAPDTDEVFGDSSGALLSGSSRSGLFPGSKASNSGGVGPSRFSSANANIVPSSSDLGDDDSIGDDLPDEALLTKQIMEQEQSRRGDRQAAQQQSTRSGGSSATSSRPPLSRAGGSHLNGGGSAAAKRSSIVLPKLGEFDPLTADPKRLDSLSPRSQAEAKRLIQERLMSLMKQYS